MNHIYRVVWNAATASWTAVAEIARGSGKRGRTGRRRRLAASVAGLLALTPPSASAQPPSVAVEPGTALNAYSAPNGVTVVNINAPNAAGLSHNRYTDFSVDPSGLVLNNTTGAQVAVQSQLAGQIMGNVNQATQSRVILNEVVSNHRSFLSGFIEVAGGKADVVVANPYGITCGGCGFINTDRATLTTGTPFFASDGALGGFDVSRGDILIGGSGLNATDQQVLDLVTRSARLASPVNSRNLGLAAGPNRWSYDAREATGRVAGTGPAPAYAIDASALGGMYADRIRLVSTEEGIGVRIASEVAANAGDFVLTGAGRIELSHRISATDHLAIRSADAIALSEAGLTSGGATLLDAAGAVSINGGALVAGTDLSISAASLLDSASASNLADNNLRHARSRLTLSVRDGAVLDSTEWASGGDWNGVFGTLATLGSARLFSGGDLNATTERGDLALGPVAMQASGDLALRASGSVALSAAGSLRTLAGDLSVAADGGLDHAGSAKADAGSVVLRVDGWLRNSGRIHAAQDLDIADRSGGARQAVSNRGELVSGRTMRLNAASLSNDAEGWMQAVEGTLANLDALDNAGVWLLSQSDVARDRIAVAGRAGNSGTLQSAGDLDLSASVLENAGAALAAKDLTARIGARLSNIDSAATIQAGGRLRVEGASAELRTAVGSRMLGDGLSIEVAAIDNSGVIQAGTHRGSRVFAAGTMNNRASGTVTLATTADGAGEISAGSLANDGRIQSAGAMAIEIGDAGLRSDGTIIAENDLALRGRDPGAGYAARVGGLIQSRSGTLALSGGDGAKLDIGPSGTVVGRELTAVLGAVVLEDGATLSSDRDMTLTLGSLSLNGPKAALLGSTELRSAADRPWHTRIATSQALVNRGLLFSANDLTVSAPSIFNSGTAGISALHDLVAIAASGDLTNQGALYAGNALSASAEKGTLTNAVGVDGARGSIGAGASIDLRGDTIVNNSAIESNGSIAIRARELRNEVAGGDTRVYGPESTPVKEETGHQGKGYICHNPFDSECYDHHEFWDYRETWHKDQHYAGGAPQVKPQIVAAGEVGLSFSIGKNLGGIISGDSVKLTGIGAGATFVNDDLSLHRTTYTRTWREHTRWYALGPLTRFERRVENDATTNKITKIDDLGIVGILARRLTGTGFALTNNGSAAETETLRKGDPQAASVSSLEGGAARKDAVNGPATSVAGKKAIAFGGISIALPSNPNGLYVIAKEPKATYLVETNPLYRLGTRAVGSDYLAKRLGYNADTLLKRLGDASYETYLVEQQLIAQTGKRVLNGSVDSTDLLRGLMDAAAGQNKALGLVYGEELSPEQQEKLTHDIVWMAQVEIDGRKVLAPRLYLSPRTKREVERVGLITAETAQLNLLALTNAGGSIVATQSLGVVSEGDVRNVSGTIKGGHVSIASTQGQIVNETSARGSGNERLYRTDIGRAASIQADKTLTINAAKDITNVGATMAAGGDVRLTAGGSLTFDTVQDRTTDTTHGSSTQDGNQARSVTTTTRVRQVQSGLRSGGNLTANAGQDILFAGSTAKIAANADLQAGRNLSIVARENSTAARTESRAFGFGMNGGLYGETTTTTDSFKSANLGSALEIGGSAAMKAAEDLTLQGSKVDVAGRGSLHAREIRVLAGKNLDETHSQTTKTTLLKPSFSESSSAGTSANATSSAGTGDGRAHAEAGAHADARSAAKAAAGLAVLERSVTRTSTSDLRHEGSTLRAGGDLLMRATGDIGVQGSTIAAGTDADIKGKSVRLSVAQDKKTSSTDTQSTSLGFLASSSNEASANADAAASAGAGKNINPNAKAGASTSARANSENRLDYVQHTRSETSTVDTAHRGSTIVTGKNLKIAAVEALETKASRLDAGADLDLAAKSMAFDAVADTHETRSSHSATSAGLYLSANAETSANAGAGVGLGAQASATAQAHSRIEGGIYSSNNRSQSVDGAQRAAISTVRSGGKLTRHVAQTLTDVGTKIQAGTDLVQSAGNIESKAAKNRTYSGSSATTDTGKLGAYAQASAVASYSISGKGQGSGSAGAGIGASYKREQADANSDESQAVVSSIEVGGDFSSASVGKTELEGSKISAGGNANIDAGTLEYKAARNESTSNGSSTQAGASVDVDIANRSVDLNGSFQNSDIRVSQNDAAAGSLAAGGRFSVRTSGDARYEGTDLSGKKRVDLVAGGKTRFDAATSRFEQDTNSLAVNGGASVSRKGSGIDLSAQGGKTETRGSLERGSRIGSANGDVRIRSGQDAKFTGVAMEAEDGDIDVSSDGELAFNAAHDRSDSFSLNASAGLSAHGGKNKGSGKHIGISKNQSSMGAPNAALDLDKRSSDTVADNRLNSGGKVRLASGKDVKLENVEIAGTKDVTTTARGAVERSNVSDTSDGFGLVAYSPEVDLRSAGDKGKRTRRGSGSNTRDSRSTQSAAGTGADYDKRIVVALQDDPVSQNAARKLADKHPQKSILVTRPEDLKGLTGQVSGNIKVTVVGHADPERREIAGKDAQHVADLVAPLQDPDGGRQVAKVNLAGCGTECMRDEMKRILAQRGVPSRVTAERGPVKVSDDGRKLVAAAEDPDALMHRFKPGKAPAEKRAGESSSSGGSGASAGAGPSTPSSASGYPHVQLALTPQQRTALEALIARRLAVPGTTTSIKSVKDIDQWNFQIPPTVYRAHVGEDAEQHGLRRAAGASADPDDYLADIIKHTARTGGSGGQVMSLSASSMKSLSFAKQDSKTTLRKIDTSADPTKFRTAADILAKDGPRLIEMGKILPATLFRAMDQLSNNEHEVFYIGGDIPADLVKKSDAP